MALEITPTSAPPVLHSEQALLGCLLVGTELIEDWLLEEGLGSRKGALGPGELAPR